MIIGCVREIKAEEYRVGLTPDNVRAYKGRGHEVLIERGAGEGSGYPDALYEAAGAEMVPEAAEVWSRCDMMIKVKEPLEAEYPRLRGNLILYTYLHLAACLPLTRALLGSGCTGVAYETIEEDGELPCLAPMSEIAGRLSVQEGAKYLEKPFGGRGVLLGGVPGVRSARVVILGAGTVGANALKMAVGMGARVSVLDINVRRLARLDDLYANRVETLHSAPQAIEDALTEADLVIGAVLVPGAAAPKLVAKKYLSGMQPGAVMVDVAIDQGGCFETSHVTYHHDPVYTVDGVQHYCVGNMPGAVPRTATLALTNATLRYGLAIADHGLKEACRRMPGLLRGVNTCQGACTYPGVADSFGLSCQAPAL